MSEEAAVVWLEQGETRDDAVRALAEWARVRGVRLGVEPGRPPAIRIDPSFAEKAEREIDRARLAIGAADSDTAERALARAETILREHPELPQAAWLRAEVERVWSARWLRLEPRDEARARIAWENAAALDGGRVAGIGETNFPPRKRAKVSIVVAGDGARLVVRLDGAALESPTTPGSYAVELAPGEHQLVATVDGEPVFASWVAVADVDPPSAVRIGVADGGACGRDRLSEAQLKDGVVQANGITCPRWIAAVPGTQNGSVLVARCERDTCGPLLEWRVVRIPTEGPPQSRPKAAPWPAWATWTMIGIGAATAASVALVASGVFETRPVEPRFVVGGARQE